MRGIVPLASMPKSGNTWLRIVLDIVLHQGVDFRLDRLSSGVQPSDRALFDEWLGVPSCDLTERELAEVRGEAIAEGWHQGAQRNPAQIWLLKAHEAYLPAPGTTALPFAPGSIDRAIYIARDPRDVALSMAPIRGISIDRAIEILGNRGATLSRHQDRLSQNIAQFTSDWSSHVLSWLDQTDFPVHLLRYEEMLAAPGDAFAGAFRFLELAVPRALLDAAIAASRFDRLRTAEREHGFIERPPHAANFFRRGMAGEWRERLTAAQCARIVEDHGDVMRRLGYL